MKLITIQDNVIQLWIPWGRTKNNFVTDFLKANEKLSLSKSKYWSIQTLRADLLASREWGVDPSEPVIGQQLGRKLSYWLIPNSHRELLASLVLGARNAKINQSGMRIARIYQSQNRTGTNQKTGKCHLIGSLPIKDWVSKLQVALIIFYVIRWFTLIMRVFLLKWH